MLQVPPRRLDEHLALDGVEHGTLACQIGGGIFEEELFGAEVDREAGLWSHGEGVVIQDKESDVVVGQDPLLDVFQVLQALGVGHVVWDVGEEEAAGVQIAQEGGFEQVKVDVAFLEDLLPGDEQPPEVPYGAGGRSAGLKDGFADGGGQQKFKAVGGKELKLIPAVEVGAVSAPAHVLRLGGAQQNGPLGKAGHGSFPQMGSRRALGHDEGVQFSAAVHAHEHAAVLTCRQEPFPLQPRAVVQGDEARPVPAEEAVEPLHLLLTAALEGRQVQRGVDMDAAAVEEVLQGGKIPAFEQGEQIDGADHRLPLTWGGDGPQTPQDLVVPDEELRLRR